MTRELSVLVVEDDFHMQLGCVQALQLAGLSVEAVDSAEQAMGLITPGFAGVIVTDMRLPGADGLSLVRHCHGLDADLPVIMITGHGDVTLAVEAMRSGAYDFIPKPFSPELLVEVVRRAIEKRSLTLEVATLRAALAGRDGLEGKLVGRVTVNEVVDYIREEAEHEQLANAGLKEEEDIFASVWDSVKNRWSWLAINLVTAFVASRVIGAFEDSIEKLVALAALMPIVAGIGGNSGNQTITMIVRAIAMGQVQPDAMRRLLRKELGVASINGLLWGGLLGVAAWWLYGSVALGLVMTAAMILNLLLAASAGVGIPLLREKFGADPAVGGSVMITALTDSGGFFIFLGLATLFLM